MNILALETSGHAGSVAILTDDQIVREILLPPTQKSASTLAPAIRDILAEVGWKNTDVRLIAVAIGPGSFTGLRVGVTTSKTLAYTLTAEVIGVGTLDVIAAQSGVSGQVSVAMNAQREQVFACEFKSGAEGYRALAPPAILDNDVWIAGLKAGMAVSGPALEKLGARIPADVTIVPSDRWSPKAAIVGHLGWLRYQSGERDDLWQLVPNYFRPSAAEEKLAARRSSAAPRSSLTAPD